MLVPRETPLSAIHLAHADAARGGRDDPLPRARLLHGAETLDDLVDFVVGEALDLLGVDHALRKRWGQ